MSNRERLTFIDGLRGIAAVGVALHHIDMYRPFPPAEESVFPRWANVLFQNGWMGVQVFFVISGFVIAYSLRHAKITTEYFARFALSRWMRLAPAYLFVAALMIAVEALSPWLGFRSPSEQALSFTRAALHVFYLQDIAGYESLSAGFWTLCIEMQFYLGFALLLGLAQHEVPHSNHQSRQSANSRGLVMLFMPLALASLFVFNRMPSHEVWLSYFFWMFFVGVLAFWTLDRRVSPIWFWAFMAAIVVRLGIDFNIRALIVMISGIGIYTVGRFNRLSSWLDIPILQYLGRVSYSFYMIHFAVNHLIVGIGFQLTGMGQGPELFWFCSSFVCSLAAAHALYLWVEVPSLEWSQWLKRTPLPSFDRRWVARRLLRRIES